MTCKLQTQRASKTKVQPTWEGSDLNLLLLLLLLLCFCFDEGQEVSCRAFGDCRCKGSDSGSCSTGVKRRNSRQKGRQNRGTARSDTKRNGRRRGVRGARGLRPLPGFPRTAMALHRGSKLPLGRSTLGEPREGSYDQRGLVSHPTTKMSTFRRFGLRPRRRQRRSQDGRLVRVPPDDRTPSIIDVRRLLDWRSDGVGFVPEISSRGS